MGFLSELRHNRDLWHNLKWAYQNRSMIKKENRWLNREDETIKYRGASYCVSCRQPIVDAWLCETCAAEQGLIVPEPNMGLIKQGQDKWNKAVEDKSS